MKSRLESNVNAAPESDLLSERTFRKRLIKQREVVNLYLNQLEEQDLIIGDTKYSDLLGKLVDQSIPMEQNCRVAVCLPVHNEERVIKTYLENYFSCGLLPDEFEVNILINGVVGYRADRTFEIIHQFCEENPHLRINVWDIEINHEHHCIGLMRKILADVVMTRSQNKNAEHPLYILSDDADTQYKTSKFLLKYRERFDSDESIDCLTGTHNRSDFERNDLVFIFSKLLILTERYFLRRQEKYTSHEVELENGSAKLSRQQEWCRLVTTGWNTAFTVTALAEIGGYDHTKQYGEDLDLSNRLLLHRASRQGDKLVISTDTIKHVPVKATSSNRRFAVQLLEFLDHGRSANPYSDFGNEEVEIRVRNEAEIYQSAQLVRFSKIGDENQQEFLGILEEIVNYLYDFVRKVIPEDKQLLENYRSFISTYGFGDSTSLSIENSRLRIIKPEKLINKICKQ